MIQVGMIVSMNFHKDPEQHSSNVVICGVYMDKVWVKYELTGNDEIIDMADVSLTSPVFGGEPNHSFAARHPSGEWMFWDHEEGFWYECSDPTQLNVEEVPEEEVQARKSSSSKVLH